jgi:hypothetical protein
MDGTDQIYQGPDGTALRFFSRPTKNNFQSEKHGRPIFDTSLVVEVMVPGSRESTPEFEVERVYSEEAGFDASGNRLVERSPKYVQYQQQIEAYKAQNGDGLAQGTPISQWPNIDVGTAATLKAAGIHTVEMLAGVNDTHLPNLGMGGRVLRDQAQAFMNSRQFGVPTMQMAADSAHLREENVRLQNEVSDLTARLSQALAELGAARTGQPAPASAPGTSSSNTGGSMLTDQLGPGTISQPDPFANLSGGSASPLTPNEGEAKDGAKAVAERTGQQTQFQPPAAPQNPGQPTPDSDPATPGFQYTQPAPALI